MSCSYDVTEMAHPENDDVLQEAYKTIFVKWVDESNAFLKQKKRVEELEDCEAYLLKSIAI